MQYACLAGLAVVLLLIPVNRWLAHKIQASSTALMAFKDLRLKRAAELLTGIREIKTSAWEPAFAKRVGIWDRSIPSNPPSPDPHPFVVNCLDYVGLADEM